MATVKSQIERKEKREAFEQMVYYATKAPSGHNSQPWKFDIKEDIIEILPDFTNSLPIVDPFHRELYISLGCATENLCVVAPMFGYKVHWEIVKLSGEHYFIAVHIDRDHEKRKTRLMADMIEKRQTNRSIYSNEIIDEELIKELTDLPKEYNVQAYFFRKDEIEFSIIKEYILKGNKIQLNDSKFKKELLSWIRFNKYQAKRAKDGLSYKALKTLQMPEIIGKFIVKIFLSPKRQNASDSLKIDSSSHIIVFTTKENTVHDWIRLGITLERFLLKLARLNIASSYLNSPCEIHALSKKLKNELGIRDEFPSVIIRIGYTRSVPYSLRKSIAQVMK